MAIIEAGISAMAIRPDISLLIANIMDTIGAAGIAITLMAAMVTAIRVTITMATIIRHSDIMEGTAIIARHSELCGAAQILLITL